MAGPTQRTVTAVGHPSRHGGAAAPLAAGARAEVARRVSALSHPRFTHPADALAWLSGLGPREFGRVARLVLTPREPVRHLPVPGLDETAADACERYGISVGGPHG
jgi:hypothetical protein